jgi:hypothetical protein
MNKQIESLSSKQTVSIESQTPLSTTNKERVVNVLFHLLKLQIQYIKLASLFNSFVSFFSFIFEDAFSQRGSFISKYGNRLSFCLY